MITDCLFRINCKIWLDIGGQRYPVFVFESENGSNMSFQSLKDNKKVSPQASPSWNDSPCMEESEFGEDDVMKNGKRQVMENDASILKPTSEIEVDAIQLPHNSRGNLKNSENLSPPMHLELQDTSNPNTYKLTNQQNHPTPKKFSQHILNPPTMANSPIKNSPKKSPKQKKPSFSPKKSILVSPKKSTTIPLIPIANNFGPLSRAKIPSPLSSFDSGPLFPPGFEENIPNQVKTAHEKRRKKKIKKKQLRNQKSLNQTSSNHISSPSSSTSNKKTAISSITPEDILDFGKKIGLIYNGSQEDLRNRIQSILDKQKEDWLSNQ